VTALIYGWLSAPADNRDNGVRGRIAYGWRPEYDAGHHVRFDKANVLGEHLGLKRIKRKANIPMRSAMKLLFVLLSVMFLAGCKNEAEKAYQQGVEDFGKGNYDKAEANFRHAISLKPDYAEAHNILGVALAKNGQGNEAVAHFQKALEIKPDYVEALNNLGMALAGCGQVDEAIAHYRKALEIKPDYAEAHNNLGMVLAGCGQADEAIAHFRKALEIKPDYAEARNNLDVASGRVRYDASK
jgi:Flp pilus assembly protein TadD